MRLAAAIWVVIGVLTGAWGGVQLYVGFYGVWDQHHKITTYRPVRARIASSTLEKVKVHSGFRLAGYAYRPSIEYMYSVENKEYRSDVVSLLKRRTGDAWAEDVVSRFPEGQEVVAYYAPENPSDAFLLKEYVFTDKYGGVLIGMFLCSLSVGLWVCVFYEFKGVPNPVRALSGWFEVLPYSRLKTKLIISLATALLWYVVGISVCGHYFLVKSPPYGWSVSIKTAIYMMVGLLPLILTVRYILILMKVKEARVFVNRDTFVLGSEFKLMFEQLVNWSRGARKSTIALVCEEKVFAAEKHGRKCTKTKKCYEAVKSILDSKIPLAGNTLQTEWLTIIPTGQNPSTPFWSKIKANQHRYAWYFKVNTKFTRKPHYKAKFPVIIRDKNR